MSNLRIVVLLIDFESHDHPRPIPRSQRFAAAFFHRVESDEANASAATAADIGHAHRLTRKPSVSQQKAQ
jgi:hypothetical protein